MNDKRSNFLCWKSFFIQASRRYIFKKEIVHFIINTRFNICKEGNGMGIFAVAYISSILYFIPKESPDREID